MNTQILEKVEKQYIKTNSHPFNVGDTVSVHNIIREGDKQRIQVFTGIVIAIKGSGIRKTFTVRKISFNIGVEKIFPLHLPNIEKIELVKKGNVRRSKLYYMRDRIGRQAMKIRAGEVSDTDQAMIDKMDNPEPEVIVEKVKESSEVVKNDEEKQSDENNKSEENIEKDSKKEKKDTVEEEKKVEDKKEKEDEKADKSEDTKEEKK